MQQLLMINIEQMLREFSAYRTFHKSDAVINMRIPGDVLDRIKAIAASQGVPYQALISSVLFSLTGAGDAPAGPKPGAVQMPVMPGQNSYFNPAMPSVLSSGALAKADVAPAQPAQADESNQVPPAND